MDLQNICPFNHPLSALFENKPVVLEYSHSAGRESLRSAMISQYNWASLGIRPDHLLICNGIAEAFAFTFFGCLDPGEEVLALSPVPASYLNLAAQAAVRLRLPATDPFKERKGIYVESILSGISKKTRAILIRRQADNDRLTVEQVTAVRKLVKERQLWLIEDNTALKPGSLHQKSFFRLEEIKEQVISIVHPLIKEDSRLQYLAVLVTQNQLMYNALLKYAQARVCPSVLDQLLVEANLVRTVTLR